MISHRGPRDRVLAVACAVALAFVVTAVPLRPAHGISCSGDTWADWNAWNDNYYVGYSSSTTCDLNGHYTIGIQQINWDDGYRQSTVDGYFGSKTRNDVIAFQAYHNLSPLDGLVGWDTWGKYRTRIYYSHENGGMDIYKTYGANRSYFGYDTGADKWYVYPGGLAERFDTNGP